MSLLLPFWFGRIIARSWNPIKVFFFWCEKETSHFVPWFKNLNSVDRGMMIVFFRGFFGWLDWLDLNNLLGILLLYWVLILVEFIIGILGKCQVSSSWDDFDIWNELVCLTFLTKNPPKTSRQTTNKKPIILHEN